ncbi:MAG: NepR family anti-sigma factor [Pseudomonadota bacterium]
MAKKSRQAIDEEIDQNIKRAFDDLVNEPLPDRFTTLLDKLKAQHADASDRDKRDGADASDA